MSEKSKETTTKIILGVLLIGSAVAIFFTTKKMIENTRAKRAEEQAELDRLNTQSSSNSGSTSSVTKPKPADVNYNKVLRPGVSSSAELKLSKEIMNKIISESRNRTVVAKTTISSSTDYWRNVAIKIKAIADLPLLDTTSKYGTATEVTARAILGYSDFTVNKVKQAQSKWAEYLTKHTK